MEIVLASSSAARADMLRAAGVTFTAHPAYVDEDAVKAAFVADGLPARDQADTLAEMKARKVSAQFPQALVIGGDQVLVCKRRIYDKPTDLDAAKEQLKALRGNPHELLSAAVIFYGGSPIWRHIGAARLTMRAFSDAFLDDYLALEGESVLASVGAYKIEGRGAQLFSRIGGDHFAILGLPLLELLAYLRVRGVMTE